MSRSKSIRVLPSVEYLRECFEYDPRTGELRWRVRPREHFATKNSWATWNGKYAGVIAGNVDSNGYRCVGVDCRIYKSHRIIWKIVAGCEPPMTVDHANGIKTDNRRCNLRVATMLQQNWNACIKKNNTSGYRGVSEVGSGRFGAHIRVDRVYQYLGTFDTPEEASVVREKIARKLHGKFYREMKK